MNDQLVPNPLANNPNFNTHKVFAAIGLILIAAIIIVGGIWWYVESQDKIPAIDETNTPVKVTTTSAKSDTKTPTATEEDETKNWKTYTSTDIGYSVKHSKDLNPEKETLAASDQEYSTTQFTIKSEFAIAISKNTGDLGKDEYDRLSSYEIGKSIEFNSAEAPTVTKTRLESIKVDGLVGLREEWVSNDMGILIYGYEIWVQKGNNYYQVSTVVESDKAAYSKNKATLDLMLSTFKIL